MSERIAAHLIRSRPGRGVELGRVGHSAGAGIDVARSRGAESDTLRISARPDFGSISPCLGGSSTRREISPNVGEEVADGRRLRCDRPLGPTQSSTSGDPDARPSRATWLRRAAEEHQLEGLGLHSGGIRTPRLCRQPGGAGLGTWQGLCPGDESEAKLTRPGRRRQVSIANRLAASSRPKRGRKFAQVGENGDRAHLSGRSKTLQRRNGTTPGQDRPGRRIPIQSQTAGITRRTLRASRQAGLGRRMSNAQSPRHVVYPAGRSADARRFPTRPPSTSPTIAPPV